MFGARGQNRGSVWGTDEKGAGGNLGHTGDTS